MSNKKAYKQRGEITHKPVQNQLPRHAKAWHPFVLEGECTRTLPLLRRGLGGGLKQLLRNRIDIVAFAHAVKV